MVFRRPLVLFLTKWDVDDDTYPVEVRAEVELLRAQIQLESHSFLRDEFLMILLGVIEDGVFQVLTKKRKYRHSKQRPFVRRFGEIPDAIGKLELLIQVTAPVLVVLYVDQLDDSSEERVFVLIRPEGHDRLGLEALNALEIARNEHLLRIRVPGGSGPLRNVILGPAVTHGSSDEVNEVIVAHPLPGVEDK